MRIPKIIERYYPELIWRMDDSEKVLYLTFDDGPTPEVTEWVLDELRKFDAKATFFCIGKNVKRNYPLYQRLLREGHVVGNHTYDHKKGWVTGNMDYMKNVLKCNELVRAELFRPPYGKIKKTQIRALREKFRIIMWDVLSEDYDTSLNSEKCTQKVISQARNGSIIVYHDSVKAWKNLEGSLPAVLRHFSDLGFRFHSIF